MRPLRLIPLSVLCALSAFGQNAIAPPFAPQFLDNSGKPLANGRVLTYDAGTVNPRATYSDVNLTIANTNPLVLNAAGRPISSGGAQVNVYLSPVSYKFVLQTSTGGVVRTADNVADIGSVLRANLASTGAGAGAALVGAKRNAANAVARTVDSKLFDIVSVKDWNVKGDSAGTIGTGTDDRAGIQQAFDEAPLHSTLFFPDGIYRIVNQSATSIDALSLTRPISLSGNAKLMFELPAPLTAAVTACSEDALGVVTITAVNSFVVGWHGQFDSAFTTNCTFLNGAMFEVLTANAAQFTFTFQGYPKAQGGADNGTAKAGMGLMKVQPQCAAASCIPDWYNWKIDGLTFTGPSSHINSMAGVVLDCSVSANANLGKIRINNLTVESAEGGYSIYMPNFTHAEGCLVASDFTYNYLGNGMYLYNGGDTLRIHGGRIVNPYGDGINLYSIIGAVDNTIEQLNIITGGSPVHIRRAQQLNIKQVEAGIHNYSGAPTPLMAPAASIWLDGTSAIDSVSVLATNNVYIDGSFMGIDENDTLSVSNLQIDDGVMGVHVGRNNWHPPYVGGAAVPVILNNGMNTVIEYGQEITHMTAAGGSTPVRFISGNGSLGRDDFQALNGLGDIYENRLEYSEDATKYPWTTLVNGDGSIAVSQVTTAGNLSGVGTGPITLPDGTVGSASRVVMVRGLHPADITDYVELLQSVSGLTNPHSATSQAWIRNYDCAAAPAVSLFGSTGSVVLATSDCKGDAYGWKPIRSGLRSKVSATTDYVLLLLNHADPSISATADVLITFTQFSANFSRYVKTMDSAVLPSHGSNLQYPVAVPKSQFGYQDTSTSSPPGCNADNRGLTYTNKSLGLDVYQQCQLTQETPAVYGWVPFAVLNPSQENYLLQSNTWNVAPFALNGTNGAVAPTVTAVLAGTVNDPFGVDGLGTVQLVQFDLNGSTTLTADSSATQVIAKPAGPPYTLTAANGVWVRTVAGTGLFYFGNGSAGTCSNRSHVATTTWQYFTNTCTNGAANDAWQIGISYVSTPNPYPDTLDLYVFGACLTYYGGMCTSPTGVPVITVAAPIRTLVTVGPPGAATVLYRCTVAGARAVGETTTVSADCGTAVDTGIRVN